MLCASGFLVVGEAVDATSALSVAASARPDVVLLDIVLPDRSGLLVAQELLAVADPPRVVLTSSRSRSDFGAGFQWPGECEFIPKHQLSGAAFTRLLAAT